MLIICKTTIKKYSMINRGSLGYLIREFFATQQPIRHFVVATLIWLPFFRSLSGSTHSSSEADMRKSELIKDPNPSPFEWGSVVCGTHFWMLLRSRKRSCCKFSENRTSLLLMFFFALLCCYFFFRSLKLWAVWFDWDLLIPTRITLPHPNPKEPLLIFGFFQDLPKCIWCIAKNV